MMRTLILTVIALIAFAANSLLARAGLIDPNMGPKEFTLIRLLSGALMLTMILYLSRQKGVAAKWSDGSWWGAAMLLLYALMFSLAYVTLDTGFGAKNLGVIEAIGAAIAFAGFVYLILPALGTPSRNGIFMMALSGIGWGVYTLLGRGAKSPLRLTSGNFARASLLALPLLLLMIPAPSLSRQGILLAIVSGAITSGCGYAVWYAVLPRLSTAISGVCQLLVPPLAALMGWAVLGEALTMRLMIATLIILGGLYIVSLKPRIKKPR